MTRGRKPKDPSMKVNRNKASTRATVHVDDRVEDTPELPPMAHMGEGWSEAAIDEWNKLWDQPIATLWLESEWNRVALYVDLYNEYLKAASTSAKVRLAGELRRAGEPLGITMYDRRRMQITVEREPKDEKPQAPKRKQPPSEDPRSSLELVS